jgi:hypothetical protein
MVRATRTVAPGRPRAVVQRNRPEPVAPSELPAHELLPGVHRVASLAKRWLLGTHQGGVKPAPRSRAWRPCGLLPI